jgi:hypothetical protein
MLESWAAINWFAVAVGAVAYFLLGAIWFTPLFGRAWDVAIGHERVKGERFPPIYYVMPLISSVLITIATAWLIAATGSDELPEALVLAAVAGIGYAAAVSFTNAVTPTTPRPLLYGAVTGGYHVVGIALVAAIVVAFP